MNGNLSGQLRRGSSPPPRNRYPPQQSRGTLAASASSTPRHSSRIGGNINHVSSNNGGSGSLPTSGMGSSPFSTMTRPAVLRAHSFSGSRSNSVTDFYLPGSSPPGSQSPLTSQQNAISPFLLPSSIPPASPPSSLPSSAAPSPSLSPMAFDQGELIFPSWPPLSLSLSLSAPDSPSPARSPSSARRPSLGSNISNGGGPLTPEGRALPEHVRGRSMSGSGQHDGGFASTLSWTNVSSAPSSIMDRQRRGSADHTSDHHSRNLKIGAITNPALSSPTSPRHRHRSTTETASGHTTGNNNNNNGVIGRSAEVMPRGKGSATTVRFGSGKRQQADIRIPPWIDRRSDPLLLFNQQQQPHLYNNNNNNNNTHANNNNTNNNSTATRHRLAPVSQMVPMRPVPIERGSSLVAPSSSSSGASSTSASTSISTLLPASSIVTSECSPCSSSSSVPSASISLSPSSSATSSSGTNSALQSRTSPLPPVHPLPSVLTNSAPAALVTPVPPATTVSTSSSLDTSSVASASDAGTITPTKKKRSAAGRKKRLLENRLMRVATSAGLAGLANVAKNQQIQPSGARTPPPRILKSSSSEHSLSSYEGSSGSSASSLTGSVAMVRSASVSFDATNNDLLSSPITRPSSSSSSTIRSTSSSSITLASASITPPPTPSNGISMMDTSTSIASVTVNNAKKGRKSKARARSRSHTAGIEQMGIEATAELNRQQTQPQLSRSHSGNAVTSGSSSVIVTIASSMTSVSNNKDQSINSNKDSSLSRPTSPPSPIHPLPPPPAPLPTIMGRLRGSSDGALSLSVNSSGRKEVPSTVISPSSSTSTNATASPTLTNNYQPTSQQVLPADDDDDGSQTQQSQHHPTVMMFQPSMYSADDSSATTSVTATAPSYYQTTNRASDDANKGAVVRRSLGGGRLSSSYHHGHGMHHHHALGELSESDLRNLHTEILCFTDYITRLNEGRQSFLNKVVGKIRTLVHSIWEHAALESYGSFVTGLNLPSSDLDLVILRVDNDKQALMRLANELRRQEWLSSLQAISTAKVPVIKLVCAMDGRTVVVDITIDTEPLPSSSSSSSSNNATGTNNTNTSNPLIMSHEEPSRPPRLLHSRSATPSLSHSSSHHPSPTRPAPNLYSSVGPPSFILHSYTPSHPELYSQYNYARHSPFIDTYRAAVSSPFLRSLDLPVPPSSSPSPSMTASSSYSPPAAQSMAMMSSSSSMPPSPIPLLPVASRRRPSDPTSSSSSSMLLMQYASATAGVHSHGDNHDDPASNHSNVTLSSISSNDGVVAMDHHSFPFPLSHAAQVPVTHTGLAAVELIRRYKVGHILCI
jgi:hypothetical protein